MSPRLNVAQVRHRCSVRWPACFAHACAAASVCLLMCCGGWWVYTSTRRCPGYVGRKEGIPGRARLPGGRHRSVRPSASHSCTRCLRVVACVWSQHTFIDACAAAMHARSQAEPTSGRACPSVRGRLRRDGRAGAVHPSAVVWQRLRYWDSEPQCMSVNDPRAPPFCCTFLFDR